MHCRVAWYSADEDFIDASMIVEKIGEDNETGVTIGDIDFSTRLKVVLMTKVLIIQIYFKFIFYIVVDLAVWNVEHI